MKILSIDNMLDIARDVKLPSFDRHALAIEKAATDLAEDLAKHFGITCRDNAEYMGSEFGGTCASFGPAQPGQPCPDPIHQGDPGGDWE